MTVINGIEIDNIQYNHNEIKTAINNNDPIEENLHVIIVISNPCQYARRFILAREFIKRAEVETNIKLYVVELCYGTKQQFCVSNATNPTHLQIRTNQPAIWHKENMINIGVKKLLPPNWKAFAWIDADIEFESGSWALDTLKVLNGCRDVVQLFSHAVDMDKQDDPMQIFQSFGFQYTKNKPYGLSKPNSYWHPGFAWAMTKKAYEKIGGIFEKSILGSGDNNMALCFIGKGAHSVNVNATNGYKQTILDYQSRCTGLRLGYIPGVIRHYFHGSKANRKYIERWQILIDNNYDPTIHVTHDESGLLIPTKDCPAKLLEGIAQYFAERNEDEGFKE
jgi:hypothetical protein